MPTAYMQCGTRLAHYGRKWIFWADVFTCTRTVCTNCAMCWRLSRGEHSPAAQGDNEAGRDGDAEAPEVEVAPLPVLQGQGGAGRGAWSGVGGVGTLRHSPRVLVRRPMAHRCVLCRSACLIAEQGMHTSSQCRRHDRIQMQQAHSQSRGTLGEGPGCAGSGNRQKGQQACSSRVSHG